MIKDYLNAINATKSDISKAFNYIIRTFSSDFKENGLTLVSTPQEIQNGTISLRQDDTYDSNEFRTVYDVFKIQVNGKIVHNSVSEDKNTKLGKSPKVFNSYPLASKDPVKYEDDAYLSLCLTYRAAISQVFEKHIKRKKQAADKKENIDKLYGEKS